MSTKKDVIIACDFSSEKELWTFLGSFGERRPWLKIGMELFYATGPELVKKLKTEGYKVFLDLKLHDIPNTVGKAMKVISELGVDMCNVHASGTDAMLRAAVEGVGTGTVESGKSVDEEKRSGNAERPLLIAVTQLTSTSQEEMNEELKLPGSVEEIVTSYAGRAANQGLDGVVCSPLEAEAIHKSVGEDFITVTPGIRLAGDDANDQQRVTTPGMAREMGSDFIVVGRSITGADDPVKAYDRCRTEFIGKENK